MYKRQRKIDGVMNEYIKVKSSESWISWEFKKWLTLWTWKERGSLCKIVANVLGSDIVVSEFKLQFSILFLTYTLGKGMNPLIQSPALGPKVPLLSFYKDYIGIK